MEKSFWEKVMEVGNVVLPAAMMAASIFVPGVPQIVKILSSIPKLVSAAQDLYEEGPAKKEVVMNVVTAGLETALSVSTGGQKETLEKLVKVSDQCVEAIVAGVKIYDDPNIDTAAYATVKMIEAGVALNDEFEWAKATASA